MDDMTTLPPGLEPHPQSGIYQLRIGIPKHLRHLFPRTSSGKLATDAYRASLKTRNRAEAITTIAHRLIAEHRVRFQALEDSTRPAPFVPLSEELEAYIAQAVQNLVLALDEQTRVTPLLVGAYRGQRSNTAVATWDQTGDFLTQEQAVAAQRFDQEQVRAWKAALARGDFSATLAAI